MGISGLGVLIAVVLRCSCKGSKIAAWPLEGATLSAVQSDPAPALKSSISINLADNTLRRDEVLTTTVKLK